LAGKSELSIILRVSTGSESIQFSEDLQKIVDTYQLSPFTAKVSNAAIFWEALILSFFIESVPCDSGLLIKVS